MFSHSSATFIIRQSKALISIVSHYPLYIPLSCHMCLTVKYVFLNLERKPHTCSKLLPVAGLSASLSHCRPVWSSLKVLTPILFLRWETDMLKRSSDFQTFIGWIDWAWVRHVGIITILWPLFAVFVNGWKSKRLLFFPSLRNNMMHWKACGICTNWANWVLPPPTL